jgi:hypothetical protein
MSRELNKPYGEMERRYALGVLALCDGDSRAAAKALKEQGLRGPSDRQLREWKTGKYAAEYLAVKKEQAPHVLAVHAERWDQVSRAATSATLKGLTRLDKDIGDIPLRELPRTVRDTSVAGGVAEDKSIKLREGTPDAATVGRNFKEIMSALKERGVKVQIEVGSGDLAVKREDAIDGTATEQD